MERVAILRLNSSIRALRQVRRRANRDHPDYSALVSGYEKKFVAAFDELEAAEDLGEDGVVILNSLTPEYTKLSMG